MEKRLSRHQLPPFKKLDLKFDISRLREDFTLLTKQHAWDGLSSEYAGLCESFQQLPPFFLDPTEKPNEYASYTQLALSEFCEDFSLDKRAEKTGTFWDRTHPHRCAKADERFYRKPIAGIPEYLQAVLDHFRPHLHRVRFAKLSPNCSVKPHIDYDTRYSIRLHIPILTHESCKMGVERRGEQVEEHFPADGSVYFVNQGLKHWATNPSAQDRVHLILSVDSQAHLQ